MERLATAASQAAHSAERLEQRVLALAQEVEACKVNENDLARVIREKDALVESLRSALADLERERNSASSSTTRTSTETLDRVAVARLETAKNALELERVVAATARLEKAAAERRAHAAEIGFANVTRRLGEIEKQRVHSETKVRRFEEIESARVVAVTKAAEAELVATQATAFATELVRSEAARQNLQSESPRHGNSNSNSNSDVNVNSSPPPVQLRVSIAADADEVLRREQNAFALSAEANAHRDAAARVVEKLVEENGALMERLERMGHSGRSVEGTFNGAASGRRDTNGDGPVVVAGTRRENGGTLTNQLAPKVNATNTHSKTTPTPSVVPTETEPAPAKPRGIWAFITGADRAPPTYVPKKTVAPE